MNPQDRGPFIFQDPHGRRWPRLRRVLLVFGLLAIGAIVWFFRALLVHPELRTPASVVPLKRQLKAAINRTEQNDPNAINWQRFYSERKTAEERQAKMKSQAAKHAEPKGEVRLGYFVNWDPNSWNSLEEHAGSLTHVAAEWFTVQGTDSRLVTEPDPRLLAFAAAHNLTVMAILRNLEGDTWQPEAVENLVKGTADMRARFIRNLMDGLRKMKAGGLLIDWQQLDPAKRDDYTDFLRQIADAVQKEKMELWFTVSPGEDFKTFQIFGDPDMLPGVKFTRPALETFVNRFVVMLHDENSETDDPGPIASQPWLEGWLKVIVEYADPDQWIAGLGVYAYDWNTTRKKTEQITFKDAMSRASDAGLDRNSTTQANAAAPPIAVVPPSYNAQYQYADTITGDEHTVSFLDAITFYNHVRAARAAEFGGVGIIRLGMEDPQIWDVLEMKGQPTPSVLRALGTIKATDTITNVGRGEIVRVNTARDDGARQVSIDPTGPPLIHPNDPFEASTLAGVHKGLLRATYTDFAQFPILYHQGAGGDHEVAITFDDGPDPDWTPKILDILKAKGVKAAFFLVGTNCETYPALVQRIVAEGHEIGNHTYYHRNLAVMSEWQMELELNMTQRAIESYTGRSTTLFRPPYNADSTPTSIAELAPLNLAQDKLGYTVVLEKIDPQDWARPGVDEIVQRVKDLRKEGNIVLLHDAGGDRSETVAALPQIIDYLRARGDRIVSLSELLDMTRDELMPPIDINKQPVERFVAGTGFRTWHGIVEFFWAFMIFSTGVVVLRTLVVAWLAHRHHRSDIAATVEFRPPLSVVIAAFNEGKVIQKTLHSVLDTDYAGPIEVIVIDDGSRDDTAAKVEQECARDARIRLVQQPNRGKSAALRHGLSQARHEIVVFLDADTQFQRCTLPALVQPLAHPLVGAVSGNARVGNLRTFVAKFQSLEYICGFNLDRRAYTELHCITVVPGAISALRRSAILAAGGFSDDTLAEDTDLTLTLHRLGYRIEYASDAIAWTEAPESYRGLAKQRFRWAFGTMQCLWKHGDLVFNPRFGALGWFSLPNIWFLQIGLVAVTPLVDGILLFSLAFGHAWGIWYWFAIVLGMDLFLALLACWMDGERLPKAFLILPMRFVYRPLLAWVIWRSIFRAFKGAFVTWGKLERTASVASRA
jgi:cellulose synthase/poly-beta-1,6-N-acetylglucosamine synthase-like glycosyltransferase/peptidoglycan/xylan/chitin deacetylase (PgdA/CDA1 family)/spore germination protein YaaH